MISWLLIVIVFVLSGYAVLLTARSRLGNVIADVALAWFAGICWFSAVSAIALFAWRVEPGPRVSVVILLLPWVAAATVWRSWWPGLRASWLALRPSRWWPRPHGWAWCLPVAFALLVLTLVVLHGKNTPTNTDDAVRVRAYTPMLAYMGDFGGPALVAMLSNGPLVTFVPLPGWQFSGVLNHFHINALMLTCLLALCVLIYAVSVTYGRPEQGVLTVFLLTCLPLYMYHVTTTYSDALYATLFAAGLFFFGLYAEKEDPVCLRAVFLFVTLTAMVKGEGEIIALTLLAIVLLFVGWRAWRARHMNWLPVVLGLVTLTVWLTVKNSYSSNVLIRSVSRRVETVLGWRQASAKAGKKSAARQQARENPQLVQRLFWEGVFGSVNYGMIFLLLAFFSIWRWRLLQQYRLGFPLLALALVFAEVFVNGIYINPQWTLDQSTVHRSLMAAATGAAVLAGSLMAMAPSGDPAADPAADTPAASRAEERLSRRARRREQKSATRVQS